MVFGQLMSVASQQVLFIWLLIIICPIYLVFANLMAKGLQILYAMSTNRHSTLHSYVGDISWLLPLKANEQEFKLVHIILMAILAAVISLLILLGVLLQSQQERFTQQSERKKQRVEQRK